MKRVLRKVERANFYMKCYYCDTEFEYDPSDVVIKWNWKSMSHMKVVSCPCCNRELLHRDSIRSNISTEAL